MNDYFLDVEIMKDPMEGHRGLEVELKIVRVILRLRAVRSFTSLLKRLTVAFLQGQVVVVASY